MNIKNILLIALLLAVLAGFYVWRFVYNKDHKNIEGAKADFKTTAVDLVKEFEANHEVAWTKYKNKVVEISGPVDSIIRNDSISSLVFKPTEKYIIVCEVLTTHNQEALDLKAKDEVVLKGEFEYAGPPEEMIGEYIAGDLRLKKSSFSKK